MSNTTPCAADLPHNLNFWRRPGDLYRLPANVRTRYVLLSLVLDATFCCLCTLRIFCAATIVEVTYLTAIKLLLLEPFIHNVVYMAPPCRCRTSARHLRWKLLKDVAEVLGTFPTWIQSLEQVDVGAQRFLLFFGWLVGELGEGRV